MMPLTQAQSRALAFLHDYQMKHGYSPSRRELAEGLAYKTENGAQEVLKRLERLGAISMADNQDQYIKILASTPATGGRKIPRENGLKAVTTDDGLDQSLLTEVIVAITERDPARGHRLLIGEAESRADEALTNLIPNSASAQFLFRQLPFVTNQLKSIYERAEGPEQSQEKADAAIRILTLTFLPYTDFSDTKAADTKKATGKAFSSESEICRFFDAIMEMHGGDGSRYFSFIRHHPQIKKNIGSDLRSRQQYFSRNQTERPLRQQAV